METTRRRRARGAARHPIVVTARCREKAKELYAAGYGTGTIAAQLRRGGFKIRRGDRFLKWTVPQVIDLLKAALVYQGERPRAVTKSARFWSQVIKDTSGPGCWLWAGRATKDGYGVFGANNRRAHRFAYEERHGDLDGRPLHHICRDKRCVNPAHLIPVAGITAHARLERLEREFIAYAKSDAFVAEMRALRREPVSA